MDEKKIAANDEATIKSLSDQVGKLASAIEKVGANDYANLAHYPLRFFWANFLIGVLRGFGTAVGFTIVAAIGLYILITLLTKMVNIPIIGMYIAEIVQLVNQYMQKGIPVH